MESNISVTIRLSKIRVDINWIGDDVGMQIGIIIPTELFREFLKERYRLLIDEIKITKDKFNPT